MAKKRKTRVDKWMPSEEQIKTIGKLAGIGMNMHQIAAMVGVSKDTLGRRKNDIAELSAAIEKGRAEVLGAVMKTAYDLAVTGQCPAMTIFYLKTRGGWSEKYGPKEDDNDIVIDVDAIEQKALNG